MSASMPWVKMYTEMLDDPKVGRMPDELKWRFVQLILYAGELDQEGYLPEDLEDVAWRLRLNADDLRDDLITLHEFGLMHVDDSNPLHERWVITNFAKRQGRSQEEKREQWREAQKRKRQDEIPEAAQDEPPADTPNDPPANPTDDTGKSHTGVINDTQMSHTPREEEIREDKKREDNNAGKPAATSLSVGTSHFLEAFGAKRFKTDIQRETILRLEKTHGSEKLISFTDWAAKKGMRLGEAVIAAENKLPTWGSSKNGPTGTTNISLSGGFKQ